jgi:hypothetical protein
MLFGITPESYSASDRNPVRLRPDSPLGKSRRELCLIRCLHLASSSTNILDGSPKRIFADRPQFLSPFTEKRLPIGVHHVAIQPETCQ